jgi:uncharacterized membrane protein YhhN
MSYTFLFVALAIAVLNWIAVEKKIKKLEYFAKPGTMIALLIWLWQNSAVQGEMLWFAVGAVFCLAGDVFLMLPQNLFIAGLVSFLLGHVFYVIGFNQPQPHLSSIVLAGALLLGLGITWLYRRLAAGLAAKGQHSLKVPVLVYSLVISLMVLSALSNIGRWGLLPALLSSAGALFFYASDSMLAWDRFVTPLPHARLRVMVTYHLGQFGILLGAFWQMVISQN